MPSFFELPFFLSLSLSFFNLRIILIVLQSNSIDLGPTFGLVNHDDDDDDKMSRHVVRLLRSRAPIHVHNSLVGGREQLSTASPSRLTWYSCGPTVYDASHVGHARAYVTQDILRRLLLRYTTISQVDYALGVTDVDDKIIARSITSTSTQTQTTTSIARKYEASFFQDLSALNVLPPTRVLRVTEHIPAIVQLVSDLRARGAAYVAHGTPNVYFSVPSRGARYSQLDRSRGGSAEQGEDEISGRRSEKKDARDFVLWKGNTHADPCNHFTWDAPWGAGRPGWHVECSAMATAALGDRLDIHSGGVDLRFPHHTNELATAEARLGLGVHEGGSDDRWVHTWLHVGHLHIAGRKMSKSLKNFVSISELCESYGDTTHASNVFRAFCLLNKYTAPTDFSNDRLAECAAHVARVAAFVRDDSHFVRAFEHAHTSFAPPCQVASEIHAAVTRMHDEVDKAIADDFNTPVLFRAVLTAVQHVRSVYRSALASGSAALAHDDARRLVTTLLTDLGFVDLSHTQGAKSDDQLQNSLDLLVSTRATIRAAARAGDVKAVLTACDKLRDTLRADFDVTVSDS